MSGFGTVKQKRPRRFSRSIFLTLAKSLAGFVPPKMGGVEVGVMLIGRQLSEFVGNVLLNLPIGFIKFLLKLLLLLGAYPVGDGKDKGFSLPRFARGRRERRERKRYTFGVVFKGGLNSAFPAASARDNCFHFFVL